VTASPGAVLRRSILAWGLGDLALGDRPAAIGWFIAELIGVALVAYTIVVFADSTWYLLPFLVGTLFIGVWAFQAILAFRRAERLQAARPPTPRGSPAAAIAWLTIPLLIWGTGFWLIGADGASPGSVLDRFVSEWPSLASGEAAWTPSLTSDAASLTDAARSALNDLAVACRAGELTPDCRTAPSNLLHDVRLRLTDHTDARATAVAESVEYVQRPTRVLLLFGGTELVPVARDTIMRLELVATPVPGPFGLELGARHWQIASASR
jgi:hypothetical protein